MEWTTIDYAGTEVEAADFLNGVWVDVPGRGLGFVPGYYVQERHGDMAGPAIRPRTKHLPEYRITLAA